MADCMMFPKDWRDFLKDYSFIDSEQVYTNGSELIQVFRVIQLIEHLLKEQEPKTGHWIFYFDDKSGHDGYKCSECGSAQPWYYDYFEHFEFCPNCGAKMEGR